MASGSGPTVRRLVVGRLSSLAKPREVELSAHSSAVVMSLHAGGVVAFLNRCPHVGTPLNMLPDQFMDRSATYLHCATHGALFQPTDGLCVQGPCAGKHLTPMSAVIEAAPAVADPLVVLLVDERALATAPKGAARACASDTSQPPTTRRAARANVATPMQLPTRSAIDDEFESVLRSLDARRPVR